MTRARLGARRFDVHAHYFPDPYLDALARFGKTDVEESRGQRFATSRLSDVDARLAMMDAAQVDVQVLSPAGQQPYFERKRDATYAARLANDTFAEFVAAHPSRLAAFATIPLPHTNESIAECNRALDEIPGVVGVTIGTSVLGRSIGDPSFEPLFAELDRRGAVLYVHPSGVGAESPLIGPYRLTWVIGAPIEDTIAVLHLITRGIPSRYPNIRIVVAQLGGALPVLLGRLDFLYQAEVPETPELPSRAARRLWYDSVVHDDALALRTGVQAFGSERIILGSDYPYQLNSAYTRAVAFVEDGDLPERDVHAILEGNATDLFGGPVGGTLVADG